MNSLSKEVKFTACFNVFAEIVSAGRLIAEAVERLRTLALE